MIPNNKKEQIRTKPNNEEQQKKEEVRKGKKE
jgi:hypothetical protein